MKKIHQFLISLVKTVWVQEVILNAIGKDNVYNCFTYAKEKIDNLKIASINIECDPTTYCVDQIANIRSFTLKDPQKATSYCPYFSKTVLVGVGLVAITSAIFYNTLKPK